jgi:hypothetical protein
MPSNFDFNVKPFRDNSCPATLEMPRSHRQHLMGAKTIKRTETFFNSKK